MLAPLVGLAFAVASCDLYFPDHRLVIEGQVRDGTGAGLVGVEVTLRRGRLRYDTPLASAATDGAGAYRLTHRLEGCSGLFDTFAVVAERRAGADTLRAGAAVACVDTVQTVDLVLGDSAETPG